MSSTKKVIHRQAFGGRSETLTVEEFIDGEFERNNMHYSCSDALDQSSRIDYLETTIAMLVDALVQSGALDTEAVLQLARQDYMSDTISLKDKITE